MARSNQAEGSITPRASMARTRARPCRMMRSAPPGTSTGWAFDMCYFPMPITMGSLPTSRQYSQTRLGGPSGQGSYSGDTSADTGLSVAISHEGLPDPFGAPVAAITSSRCLRRYLMTFTPGSLSGSHPTGCAAVRRSLRRLGTQPRGELTFHEYQDGADPGTASRNGVIGCLRVSRRLLASRPSGAASAVSGSARHMRAADQGPFLFR